MGIKEQRTMNLSLGQKRTEKGPVGEVEENLERMVSK